MAGCAQAHLRMSQEELLQAAEHNGKGHSLGTLHQKHLQEADHTVDHRQIRDHQQLKICSAAEKEPLVVQESVHQMEGHLVAPAYSDQEKIQPAKDQAATPIVANLRLAQILSDRQAGHLATQVLTDLMGTPVVANHRVIPAFNDLQEGLLPAQIFSAPVEVPIAESRLVAPVFKDLLAGQVVPPPDHQEVPVQRNQAVQTVEEDIDLPLFFCYLR